MSSEGDRLTKMELKTIVPQFLGPVSPILPPHPPGAPLDPTFLFQCITANIICSIVFGERFEYTDRQFLRLLELFYQTFSLISSFSSQVSGWEKRAYRAEETRGCFVDEGVSEGWKKGRENMRDKETETWRQWEGW